MGPRDLRWLRLAAKVAELSEHHRRLGCVIVRSNRVLAMGVNARRNDPSCCGERLWDASEHAEAAALRRCGRADGAVAYIVRLGRDGSWRHAQPCRRCREMLENSGVRAVWWWEPRFLPDRAPTVELISK